MYYCSTFFSTFFVFFVFSCKVFSLPLTLKFNNKTDKSGFVFAKVATKDFFNQTKLKNKIQEDKYIKPTKLEEIKFYMKIEPKSFVIKQIDLPDNIEYAIRSFIHVTDKKEIDSTNVENISLKKNSWGKPVEPYGFSRNIKHIFGPPTFEEVSFKLNKKGEYLFSKNDIVLKKSTMEINLT